MRSIAHPQPRGSKLLSRPNYALLAARRTTAALAVVTVVTLKWAVMGTFKPAIAPL